MYHRRINPLSPPCLVCLRWPKLSWAVFYTNACMPFINIKHSTLWFKHLYWRGGRLKRLKNLKEQRRQTTKWQDHWKRTKNTNTWVYYKQIKSNRRKWRKRLEISKVQAKSQKAARNKTEWRILYNQSD